MSVRRSLLPVQRYASVVHAVVRLSVCLSQASTVPKRLNAGSQKTAPCDRTHSSFLVPKILSKFRRGYPQEGHQIEVG